MTYVSLPLSFAHPSSIVMHPPKPMELSAINAYADEIVDDDDTAFDQSSPLYIITKAAGQKSMRGRVALFAGTIETTLRMQSGFDTPGHIHWSLTGASGQPVLEDEAWMAQGSGSHDIDMSGLLPGRYDLLVVWSDADERSAVIYQIEKLL